MRNLLTVECFLCKKKFKTFDSNKKFCTLSCEEEFYNSEANNRLFNIRKLYETCLGCGEPLKQSHTKGRKRKFCCDKCRWIYYNTIRKRFVNEPHPQ